MRQKPPGKEQWDLHEVPFVPAGKEGGGWPRGDVPRDILEPKAIKARDGMKQPALGSV